MVLLFINFFFKIKSIDTEEERNNVVETVYFGIVFINVIGFVRIWKNL
jgi:hypothetical protein